MSRLETVLKRLKRQYEAYEEERNDEDEDGFIDVSLACDLADSIPYLIETIEWQQKEINGKLEEIATLIAENDLRKDVMKDNGIVLRKDYEEGRSKGNW